MLFTGCSIIARETQSSQLCFISFVLDLIFLRRNKDRNKWDSCWHRVTIQSYSAKPMWIIWFWKSFIIECILKCLTICLGETIITFFFSREVHEWIPLMISQEQTKWSLANAQCLRLDSRGMEAQRKLVSWQISTCHVIGMWIILYDTL